MKKLIITTAAVALTLSGCMLPTNAGNKTLGSGTSPYSAPSTTYEPIPTISDFSLDVIETERSCFGSYGCNVQYRVVPTYIGTGSVPTSNFTLLYQIDGADDVQTGNIAVSNGKFATETGFTSVAQGVSLAATVTSVLED